MVVEKYMEKYEQAWDRFIWKESLNGTFFQTRNFLNYHSPDCFVDHSLIFKKGNNFIAVIPANEIDSDGRKKLISHMGSSFGGLILGKEYNNISDIKMVFSELDEYLKGNNFAEVQIRQSNDLYTEGKSDILEYFFRLNDYDINFDMGYSGKIKSYASDLTQSFHASRRRGYRKSLAYNMEFCTLDSDEQIEEFYDVLCDNLTKYQKKPGHTLEELLDLKNNRLKEIIKFYGIYCKGKMIGGSMVYCIAKKVFQTHYLATRQEYTFQHTSEYLYYNLIREAREQGFENIAFGICTLERGSVLHESLAQFKEGFGTQAYINRLFLKSFC